MDRQCICETGEELQSPLRDYWEKISVYRNEHDGAWYVGIDFDDIESGGEYGPIYHCPICGRELK